MPLDATGTASYERSSISLLSRQPVSLGPDPEREAADWNIVFNHCERRLRSLKGIRWSWLATWMDIGAFFIPRRTKWFITPNQYARGRFLNDQIIDSTGAQALLTCASGMWSGLTNPARVWFRFAPSLEDFDLDEDARAWLEELQRKSMAVLHTSNFYSIMAQFFQDLAAFGTSPIICYEDDEQIVRFYLPCAGEYMLGSSSRFTNDTLYREFTLTVEQIVGMFALKNCPAEIRVLWEDGDYDKEYVVCQGVEPNYPISGKGKRQVQPVPSRFPVREIYWLRGVKGARPLSARGFEDKPFVAGRWWLVGNDAYGRGPCDLCLGDNKQVQTETLRKAEFLEKGVRPPMIADPELKNEPASVMPGMITFVNTANSRVGFKPAFEVNAVWLQHLTVDIKSVNDRIREALYVPQFMAITMMQGVQPRNELELTKRDLERLQILGPVIDLFENEVASPLLGRVVAIMQRKGMIRPMPRSLRGVPLKIQYQSIMRLAQKAAESVTIKDAIATGGAMSLSAKNAGVPDPLRIVNLDRLYRRYLDMNSVPVDCVFPEDVVKKHDDERAAAVAQEKMQAQLSSLAPTAVDAAKVLSDTEIGGGSMLNSLLSGSVVPS